MFCFCFVLFHSAAHVSCIHLGIKAHALQPLAQQPGCPWKHRTLEQGLSGRITVVRNDAVVCTVATRRQSKEEKQKGIAIVRITTKLKLMARAFWNSLPHIHS